MEQEPTLRDPETALEREFSPENISRYGEMCAEVGLKLTEALARSEQKNKRTAILLPSRGAVPIFIGALLALKHHSLFEGEPEFREIPDQLTWPPTRLSQVTHHLEELNAKTKRYTPILLFPYTADINFSDVNPNLSEAQKTELAGIVRRFCVKATSAFYQPPEKREKNSEFARFLRFLEIVERNKELAEHYRTFPQVDNLIIIDTVISGRAAGTILGEFQNQNLLHEPILVVDRDGAKLKKPFKGSLLAYPETLIFTPRILTEDCGAALEGVVAVVYPGLMLQSWERGNFVSTGNWQEVPEDEREKYEKTFRRFLKLIILSFGGKTKKLHEARENFLNKLREEKLLVHESPHNTSAILQNQNGVTRITETRAHVVQVNFTPPKTKELLDKILGYN